MMLRRIFLQAGLALGLAVVACVLPATARAESGDEARQYVESLAQRAISTVADKQISEKERDERFRNLFVSSFDIPEIGRFVLARYWRIASPDQQQEFVRLFEEMTVLTWAKRFRDYSGEHLEALDSNRDGDHGWMIDSRIVRNQGPPIPVQWRLREGPEGLRVVDLIVEGVSLAITHRSDYGAAMQGNGGKIDALLSTMRTKIDQLKAAG
ncbi:MAG TPA: ABC transporter substrate-binding protein [Patescibacteria group bacterium]|nr:ABC transporter substrate-binding protein [Patescibacteria group bacterium]